MNIFAKLLFLILLNQSASCQSTTGKNKIIFINGYLGGNIPLSVVKKAKELQVLPPYKLLSATVYFTGGQGTQCVTTSSLKSTKFDPDFLQIWKRLGVSSIITFDNIQVKKPNGEIGTLVSTSFVITED